MLSSVVNVFDLLRLRCIEVLSGVRVEIRKIFIAKGISLDIWVKIRKIYDQIVDVTSLSLSLGYFSAHVFVSPLFSSAHNVVFVGFSPTISTHNSCDLVWITSTLVRKKFAISSLCRCKTLHVRGMVFFFVCPWKFITFLVNL